MTALAAFTGSLFGTLAWWAGRATYQAWRSRRGAGCSIPVVYGSARLNPTIIERVPARRVNSDNVCISASGDGRHWTISLKNVRCTDGSRPTIQQVAGIIGNVYAEEHHT